MRNEPPENFLLSFGVGAAAGLIAALLIMPYSIGKSRGRAPGADGGGLPALLNPGESQAEIPGNWKTYFSSLLERLIMAVQAGREEMRRAREEYAENGNRERGTGKKDG